jgi:hypothetical protein
MKAAEDFFNVQAHYNKWLLELTPGEKAHVKGMMEQFAKEEVERLDQYLGSVVSTENNLTYVDGQWFYSDDKDGDQPISMLELYETIQQP